MRKKYKPVAAAQPRKQGSARAIAAHFKCGDGRSTIPFYARPKVATTIKYTTENENHDVKTTKMKNANETSGATRVAPLARSGDQWRDTCRTTGPFSQSRCNNNRV